MNKISCLNQIIMSSFANELEKIALNLEQMRTASGALRNKIVRGTIDISKTISNPSEPVLALSRKSRGMFTLMPSLMKSDASKQMNAYATRIGVKPLIPNVVKKSTIFMGKGGVTGMEGEFKNQGVELSMKHLNPQNREAVNRIGIMHEGAESQVRPSGHQPFGSHASPEVLLKEHNMIQTLPSNLKPAGDVYRNMRGVFQESLALNQMTGGKFNYGESPRLSRHAIRRISQGLTPKLIAGRNAAFGQ